MTRSERDLVTALRAELAAIDPSRACDRVAERPVWVRRRTGREPSVGPARRPPPTATAMTDTRLASTGRARADHCRTAWLRGRFLARGSLSLAGGRTHLEFVVDPDEAPVLAERLADIGLPGVVADPAGSRRRDLEERRGGRDVPAPDRRAGALLELEARQVSRALRGELNRVLNAESANLQRAVSAAGRQLDAIDHPRGGRPPRRQPPVVRLVADARRETPEATLAELAERLAIHRSAVQRALERIERLARRAGSGGRRSGMIRRDA